MDPRSRSPRFALGQFDPAARSVDQRHTEIMREGFGGPTHRLLSKAQLFRSAGDVPTPSNRDELPQPMGGRSGPPTLCQPPSLPTKLSSTAGDRGDRR